MNKSKVILGSGGHASVLVDILQQKGIALDAVISPQMEQLRAIFKGIAIIAEDVFTSKPRPDFFSLINGLGSIPGNTLRFELYQKYIGLGFSFYTVTSPYAVISDHAELAMGVQVMPGAIIQIGAYVGENSIINSGAIIEHDCRIGNHNHIAPSATLCGGVVTGKNVHVGTGATVIQGVHLDDGVVVAAGAIVNKDVPKNHIIYPGKGLLRNLRDIYE